MIAEVTGNYEENRGRNMVKVEVMSAKDALVSVYSGGPFRYGHNKDYILISITDKADAADLPVIFQPVESLKQVKRIPFYDIPPSQVDKNTPLYEQFGFVNNVFSWDTVGRLKDIADQAESNNWNILVHCEAGVSRSQAIGAFLEVYLNKDFSNLHKRLHDWNTEFFRICWQALASHSRSHHPEKEANCLMMSEWQEPIYQQRKKGSDNSLFGGEGQLVLPKRKTSDVPQTPKGQRLFRPTYPSDRMLTLKNIAILKHFSADAW